MKQASIRPARPEDVGGIVEIWRLSFGDDASFIRKLLLNLGLISSCTVAEGPGGQILSAMCSFDGLQLGGVPSSYIYALCTHPEFRSLGLGGRVAREASRRAFRLGAELVCLHAASPRLEGWYSEILNMKPLSFSVEKQLAPAPLAGASFEKISAAQALSFFSAGGFSLQLLRVQELIGDFFLCRFNGMTFPFNAELLPNGEAVIRGLSLTGALGEKISAAAGCELCAKSIRLILPSRMGSCNLMGFGRGGRDFSGIFLPFLLE